MADENVDLSVPTSSQDAMLSSPAAPSSKGATKPRRPPPITPRRFNRFFSPRSSTSSRSGRELRDITRHGINGATSVRELDFDDIAVLPGKRRKTSEHASPQYSSPPRHESPTFDSSPGRSSPCVRSPVTPKFHHRHLNPVQRSSTWKLALPNHTSSTANFSTMPDDARSFHSGCVPFCIVACNTNSLVAIGDEAGSVSIIDSARSGNRRFGIDIQTRRNAIMDMAFSSDDALLVTSSGDQASHVIDVQTQTLLYCLGRHNSSVKQVAFQPDNDCIIATSSRDGGVAIWDTRLRQNKEVFEVNVAAGTEPNLTIERRSHEAYNVAAVSRIWKAHPQQTLRQSTLRSQPVSAASVTAISFLKTPRSHLLVTASDGGSTLRLWDIRGRARTDAQPNTTSIPVSSTPALQGHQDYRHFGLTSLSLSTNGGRIYGICRDNTAYAWSTNHLVLGSASMSSSTSTPRFSKAGGADGKNEVGLEPLYGFRDAKFHASSFYVRSAIRRSTSEHEELLAVGSSDACPVLFPTMESSFRAAPLQTKHHTTAATSSSRLVDTIPIYEHGTPLIRGHSAEVTGLAWTTEGDLVTISDDRVARIWREDEPHVARDLRRGGEQEGRRWGRGWAEVADEWDDDDG